MFITLFITSLRHLKKFNKIVISEWKYSMYNFRETFFAKFWWKSTLTPIQLCSHLHHTLPQDNHLPSWREGLWLDQFQISSPLHLLHHSSLCRTSHTQYIHSRTHNNNTSSELAPCLHSFYLVAHILWLCLCCICRAIKENQNNL